MHEVKNLNPKQLQDKIGALRSRIIAGTIKNGGHLASNLGAVELTVALHRVFDPEIDRIVFDVGHQCYAHKLLTGRDEYFDSLRMMDGLSGFPKRNESPSDAFGTGHASTALSAALGLARARDILGQNHDVIAVVGDGSLTGGMAFEALNDAGLSKTRLIVVLNDNEMSISRNVGAISGVLSDLRANKSYYRFKNALSDTLGKIPWAGKRIKSLLERIKNTVKFALVPGVLFEQMGFTYLGPVDGHNVKKLTRLLAKAKALNKPVLIHAITQKGKGYAPAEANPEDYHGISPNAPSETVNGVSGSSYSTLAGKALIDLAQGDPRVVAITAAMPAATGLKPFAAIYPKRFFDVGIAEEHAVTLSSGLAAGGLKPYVAVYSTFLQRSYDQIIHDICLQGLPVTLLIDRAGITGEDGETHQGAFDIAYLRHIPNMAIWAPANYEELRSMIRLSANEAGPVAIRYPKGKQGSAAAQLTIPEGTDWVPLSQGRDACILAVGKMVDISLRAAELLGGMGIDVGVVYARSIKPLDGEALCACRGLPIVTVEDGCLPGGFGSSVLEYFAERSLDARVRCVGIPDSFIEQGHVDQLFKRLALDPEGISLRIKSYLEEIG